MTSPGKFPVRRYLVALPVAALTFMALAVLDERETFLSALRPPSPPAPVAAGPSAESDRAVEAVRAFARALETAYRDGSSEPLAPLALSPELRAELALELGDARLRPATAGLALRNFELLAVEPAGEGAWQVTTDETWMGAAGGKRHRLRFRYALAGLAGDLRIDGMVPMLPEPGLATAP